MSKLTILSDADLDAVAGGILNGGSATGGDGGQAVTGASISNSTGNRAIGAVVVNRANLSTNCSPASADGGNARGGSVITRVRVS